MQSQPGLVTSMRHPGKRVMEPPWLQMVNWSQKVALMYTVPNRKKNRVLKEDRDALCKMRTSDLLLQQMKDLQEEVEEKGTSPTVVRLFIETFSYMSQVYMQCYHYLSIFVS